MGLWHLRNEYFMIERLEILQVKCLLAHAGYVKNASSETIRHMPIHLKFVLPTWKLAVQEKTGRQLASGHATRQGCTEAEEQTLPPEVLGRTWSYLWSAHASPRNSPGPWLPRPSVELPCANGSWWQSRKQAVWARAWRGDCQCIEPWSDQ